MADEVVVPYDQMVLMRGAEAQRQYHRQMHNQGYQYDANRDAFVRPAAPNDIVPPQNYNFYVGNHIPVQGQEFILRPNVVERGNFDRIGQALVEAYADRYAGAGVDVPAPPQHYPMFFGTAEPVPPSKQIVDVPEKIHRVHHIVAGRKLRNKAIIRAIVNKQFSSRLNKYGYELRDYMQPHFGLLWKLPDRSLEILDGYANSGDAKTLKARQMLLEVKDPSTGNKYFLAINEAEVYSYGEGVDAHSAVAWTFGQMKHGYYPQVET